MGQDRQDIDGGKLEAFHAPAFQGHFAAPIQLPVVEQAWRRLRAGKGRGQQQGNHTTFGFDRRAGERQQDLAQGFGVNRKGMIQYLLSIAIIPGWLGG